MNEAYELGRKQGMLNAIKICEKVHSFFEKKKESTTDKLDNLIDCGAKFGISTCMLKIHNEIKEK